MQRICLNRSPSSSIEKPASTHSQTAVVGGSQESGPGIDHPQAEAPSYEAADLQHNGSWGAASWYSSQWRTEGYGWRGSSDWHGSPWRASSWAYESDEGGNSWSTRSASWWSPSALGDVKGEEAEAECAGRSQLRGIDPWPSSAACAADRGEEAALQPARLDDLLADLFKRHPHIAQDIGITAATSLKFKYLQASARGDDKESIQEIWDSLGTEEQHVLMQAHVLADGDRDELFLKIVEEDALQRWKLSTLEDGQNTTLTSAHGSPSTEVANESSPAEVIGGSGADYALETEVPEAAWPSSALADPYLAYADEEP